MCFNDIKLFQDSTGGRTSPPPAVVCLTRGQLHVSLCGRFHISFWDSLTFPCWTLFISSNMTCFCVLATIGVIVTSAWDETGSQAMTLDSVRLPQVLERGEGVQSHQRRKRSWVWNQFFVVEEYTGDEPLYVGKVTALMSQEKTTCHLTRP